MNNQEIKRELQYYKSFGQFFNACSDCERLSKFYNLNRQNKLIKSLKCRACAQKDKEIAERAKNLGVTGYKGFEKESKRNLQRSKKWENLLSDHRAEKRALSSRRPKQRSMYIPPLDKRTIRQAEKLPKRRMNFSFSPLSPTRRRKHKSF